MTTQEVIYADGSRSEIRKGGGATHSGELAIHRLRLITAKSALDIYIKHGGKMELMRGGAQAAIENVIAPLTGKTYKRSLKGKQEALNDCIALLTSLEQSAVVITTEEN